MVLRFEAHPDNPQPRLIKQAADMLRQGAILAIPTDSSYALVCHLDDRPAVERLRRIRQINDKHHLTLLCRDLSELSSYARVDNRQYRLLKLATLVREIRTLTRERNVALCLHDMAGSASPRMMTAKFVYVRFHGAAGTYSGGYSKDNLSSWAGWLAGNRAPAFLYFNNDVGGHAPRDATQLREMLDEAEESQAP